MMRKVAVVALVLCAAAVAVSASGRTESRRLIQTSDHSEPKWMEESEILEMIREREASGKPGVGFRDVTERRARISTAPFRYVYIRAFESVSSMCFLFTARRSRLAPMSSAPPTSSSASCRPTTCTTFCLRSRLSTTACVPLLSFLRASGADVPALVLHHRDRLRVPRVAPRLHAGHRRSVRPQRHLVLPL